MNAQDAREGLTVWIKERNRPDVRRTCGPDAQGNFVGRGGMLIPDITLMLTQSAVIMGIGHKPGRALLRFPRNIELWCDVSDLTTDRHNV